MFIDGRPYISRIRSVNAIDHIIKAEQRGNEQIRGAECPLVLGPIAGIGAFLIILYLWMKVIGSCRDFTTIAILCLVSLHHAALPRRTPAKL
jgi:hypothetical protein